MPGKQIPNVSDNQDIKPFLGPKFQLVETISAEQFYNPKYQPTKSKAILVKGAINHWPAKENWTFSNITHMKRKDGSEINALFSDGVAEQGVTLEPVLQPIAPYLEQLASETKEIQMCHDESAGLCPDSLLNQLRPGDEFFLNWSYLNSLPKQIYLALWELLKELPDLRKDYIVDNLWKNYHWTSEYAFIGPANTITGLHYDTPDNWFCQIQGIKEFLLFPPENNAHMCPSTKYDWGSVLSCIDITHLQEQPHEREEFEKTYGFYARCEPGDALFIPKKTWHCVVALEPSISLATFGLTFAELFSIEASLQLTKFLHFLHLYRWGNCTCHKNKAFK